MTVMNPKFDTFFLHSLHEQFFGSYFLISFLKAIKLVNFFNSKRTIFQILGPKYEYFHSHEKQILCLVLQTLK